MEQQLPGVAGSKPGRDASNPRNAPPKDLLEDLCSRFVLNVPAEELESFDRMLFQLEQAHWFYEDNAREHNPSLKSLSLKDFTSLMFQQCDALKPYKGHIEEIYENFTSYKVKVPVMGAIILNKTLDKCLLVKGWKAGASWGFPKGKKNRHEPDVKCAVREVEEETGFSLKDLISEIDYLECEVNQQRCRLYVVPGVDENTVFTTQTVKEISEIAWHFVSDLPEHSSPTAAGRRASNGCKYFMVGPFTRDLKAWIASHKARREAADRDLQQQASQQPAGSTSITSSQGPKPHPSTEMPQSMQSSDPPGRSFRDFKFDHAFVMRAMETALSSQGLRERGM